MAFGCNAAFVRPLSSLRSSPFRLPEAGWVLLPARLKYTAPSYDAILNEKRPKFKTFKNHRTGDLERAKVSHMILKNKERLEEKCKPGTSRFQSQVQHDFTSLECQMESLKTKGFLRSSYRSYTPPSDLMSRFLSACGEALNKPQLDEASLVSIRLDTMEDKFNVLNLLAERFDGYAIHNSRLHEINTLADALLFYQSPVSVQNPYEMLHSKSEAGQLPPNLCIQLEPHRFTGKGDHPLDQVTAFPRSVGLSPGLGTAEKFPQVPSKYDSYDDLDYK